MNKAVFLDRDGVINRKRDDYVKNIDEFVMLQGVPKAIRLLNEKNFLVIIITNQSVINRGLLTHEGLEKIHDFMRSELKKNGSVIDAIYYCPHRPDENCNCRKPKTELIKRAVAEHFISADLSWFVGDSESDMVAAKESGIRAIKLEESSRLLDSVKVILNKENVF